MVFFVGGDVYTALKGQDERMAGSYGYFSYDFPYRRDKLLNVISQKSSFFWAVLGDEGEPGESLLDQADKAMYLGKSLGRDRVCSADELRRA